MNLPAYALPYLPAQSGVCAPLASPEVQPRAGGRWLTPTSYASARIALADRSGEAMPANLAFLHGARRSFPGNRWAPFFFPKAKAARRRPCSILQIEGLTRA